MSLQPAIESNLAGKVALFGSVGSGKSITATLLAVGLSVELHNHAPIALVDPEGVQQFLKPICDAENVPLLVEPSRSFVGMRDALKEAEDAECCAFVVDHYDGVHRELVEAQKQVLSFQGRRLPYQHREELMRLWDEWVRTFRSSRLHTIFNGRLAWDWGDDEDESGDPIFVKLGTKMRGDADAGYEPNLLIEMERIDNFKRDPKSKSKEGEITHVARVLKDRRMRLNGLSFSWKDLNGYKAGQYKAVWKTLSPHFDGLVGARPLDRPDGPQPRIPARSSSELFSPVSGETRFAEDARRRQIALEEIQGVLNTIWPGSTNDEKKMKTIIFETLFKTRSQTLIGGLAPEVLESAWKVMQEFEREAAQEENKLNPRSEAEVIALIASCKDLQQESEKASVF